MSLLSKYAYYALYNQKQYPLGFPIYDSLALDAYPTVCKMLGIEQHTEIANDICNYVAALDNVRTILFGNDDLFQGQYQQFDILDAYLWRMGKFSGGNLSLLLGREDYVTFIKNLGLNANPIVGRKNAFYEKDSDYKSRMMKKGTNSETEFDFNKTIVKLYIDSSCQPFIGMKDSNTQAYMEKLLEHWRIFNNAKKLPARFIKKDNTISPATSAVSTIDYNTQTRNRDKADYVFNGKKVNHGVWTLEIADDKSVKIYKNGEPCKKTSPALRELAAEIGFTYDPKWNTRQLGGKLFAQLIKLT